MHPLNIVSPASTPRGIDSPVNADVSNVDIPSTILPSSGIFSPGLITIKSPILTS